MVNQRLSDANVMEINYMRKEKSPLDLLIIIVVLIVTFFAMGGITAFMSRIMNFWSASDTHMIAQTLNYGLLLALISLVAIVIWNAYNYMDWQPSKRQTNNIRVVPEPQSYQPMLTDSYNQSIPIKEKEPAYAAWTIEDPLE